MLHVDLDAFFASLEEARKPEIRGKPVIVYAPGGNGAVVTANYKAREKGIKAGMPLSLAREKCPEGIFITADKEYYRRMSRKIMEFLSSFGEMEEASIDEAYLIVEGDEWEKAREIKHEIAKRFGISASVGIGKNIMLSKIASKLAKPNGIKEVKSIEELDDYEVSIIPGIGKKLAEKLKALGIERIKDLRRAVRERRHIFIDNFGRKTAAFLINAALGRARDYIEDVEKYSIGKIEFLTTYEATLKSLVDRVYEELLKEDKFFSRVMVSFFYEDMSVSQRSKKVLPSRNKQLLEKTAKALLSSLIDENKPPKRIGLFVAIEDAKGQSTLEGFV